MTCTDCSHCFYRLIDSNSYILLPEKEGGAYTWDKNTWYVGTFTKSAGGLMREGERICGTLW